MKNLSKLRLIKELTKILKIKDEKKLLKITKKLYQMGLVYSSSNNFSIEKNLKKSNR